MQHALCPSMVHCTMYAESTTCYQDPHTGIYEFGRATTGHYLNCWHILWLENWFSTPEAMQIVNNECIRGCTLAKSCKPSIHEVVATAPNPLALSIADKVVLDHKNLTANSSFPNYLEASGRTLWFCTSYDNCELVELPSTTIKTFYC